MDRKIIIDSDPGIDDALAIIAANKVKDIDILGITTVAGNVSLKNTSINALNLLDTLEWDIPVSIGAGEPLELKRKLSDENTAFEKIKLKESKNKFHSKNAVDFIYENAKKYKGKLEIFALAPMTNIAMALEKYPDLKDMIKSIYFMGGTLDKGNIRPWAEFNVFVDPHATDIVFNSGIAVSMIGLNITGKEMFEEEDMTYLSQLKTKHGKLAASLFEAIRERECLFGNNRILAHDLVAFYAMLHPDKIKTKKYRVLIDRGHDNRGMLRLDYRGVGLVENGVNIAIEIDEEDFRAWIKELLKQN